MKELINIIKRRKGGVERWGDAIRKLVTLHANLKNKTKFYRENFTNKTEKVCCDGIVKSCMQG